MSDTWATCSAAAPTRCPSPRVDVARAGGRGGTPAASASARVVAGAAALVGAVVVRLLAVRGDRAAGARAGAVPCAVPSEQRRRGPDRDPSARVRRGLHRARRGRDLRRGRRRGLPRRHRRRRGVHDRLRWPGQPARRTPTGVVQRHPLVQRRVDHRGHRPGADGAHRHASRCPRPTPAPWSSGRTRPAARRAGSTSSSSTTPRGARWWPDPVHRPSTTRSCTSTRARSSSTPTRARPGCWVIDIQSCSDPHLLRYDLASGDDPDDHAGRLRGRAAHATPCPRVGRAAGRHRDGVHRTRDGAVQPGRPAAGRRWTRTATRPPSRLTTGEPVALRLPDRLPGPWRPRCRWCSGSTTITSCCSPTRAEATLPDHGGRPPGVPACRTACAASRSRASSTTYRCARLTTAHSRSMIVTLAWPPPSHMVCRP